MDSFEYVLAVAEEKSITKAAAKLFITQPALTLRINRLEKELGIQIFDRSRIPLEVTEEGLLYITEMKKIKSHEEKLRNALYAMTHKTNRHLTLGIGINRGSLWLPVLLPRLRQIDPNLSIQIRETSDGTMEQLIKSGEIDAGIMGSAILSQELTSIPLGKEPLFWAFHTDHPALRGKDLSNNSPHHPCIITPECLNRQTFIFSQEPYGITRYFHLVCSLYHITPGNILNIANTETAYRLAGAGMGITLTFAHYHNKISVDGINRPILCSIHNHMLERSSVLACRLAREDDPLIQLLAAEVKKVAALYGY